MRDFATDRPDTTESAYTVDAGHLQVEASFVEYATDKTGGETTSTLDIAPTNLKLGLTNFADLQLVLTPYETVKTRTPAGATSVSGFGDAEIRLKLNLWGNDAGATALAIMPYVKLPTGGKGLTNHHVEGGVIVPFAADLGGEFSLGAMVQLDRVYDEARGRYGFDLVHTATLGHPIAGKLAGYAEYVGVVPHYGGGGYRAIVSGGLTYPLADNWILDAGGKFGLSGEVDDVMLFVGSSVRF